jgi:hypothetical protein
VSTGNIATRESDTLALKIEYAHAPPSHRLLTMCYTTLADCQHDPPEARLLSLWYMQEYLGGRLSILLAQLREIEQKLKPVRVANLQGPGAEATVRELLEGIAQESERLYISASQVQILKERLDAGSPLAALATHFSLLHETIERDLKKTLFLVLSPEEAKQYRDPTAEFARTITAFPKAEIDIRAARRCYLLGQDTACIFHCMGILQHGLFSLAANLGVEFPRKIELEMWGTIIGRIETAIDHKRKTLPQNTDERDDHLTFYSALAMRFTYFKDAWRNHVCHLRDTYDHDQALTVLMHVRDFMELLSSRLAEVPEPTA